MDMEARVGTNRQPDETTDKSYFPRWERGSV